MRKFFLLLFLLPYSLKSFAINIPVPTSDTGGLFVNFKQFMIYFSNFIFNEVAFVLAIIISLGVFVAYKLDPNSKFMKEFLSWGLWVVGIFWIVSFVSVAYSLF